MNYLEKLVDGVHYVFNLNAATLSGAIDIIAIPQADGTLKCTPFHVRFGKLQLISSREKIVTIIVNGIPANFQMKLGNAGEAFFVEETEEPIPQFLQTSPLGSPTNARRNTISTAKVPAYLSTEELVREMQGSRIIAKVTTQKARAVSSAGTTPVTTTIASTTKQGSPSAIVGFEMKKEPISKNVVPLTSALEQLIKSNSERSAAARPRSDFIEIHDQSMNTLDGSPIVSPNTVREVFITQAVGSAPASLSEGGANSNTTGSVPAQVIRGFSADSQTTERTFVETTAIPKDEDDDETDPAESSKWRLAWGWGGLPKITRRRADTTVSTSDTQAAVSPPALASALKDPSAASTQVVRYNGTLSQSKNNPMSKSAPDLDRFEFSSEDVLGLGSSEEAPQASVLNSLFRMFKGNQNLNQNLAQTPNNSNQISEQLEGSILDEHQQALGPQTVVPAKVGEEPSYLVKSEQNNSNLKSLLSESGTFSVEGSSTSTPSTRPMKIEGSLNTETTTTSTTELGVESVSDINVGSENDSSVSALTESKDGLTASERTETDEITEDADLDEDEDEGEVYLEASSVGPSSNLSNSTDGVSNQSHATGSQPAPDQTSKDIIEEPAQAGNLSYKEALLTKPQPPLIEIPPEGLKIEMTIVVGDNDAECVGALPIPVTITPAPSPAKTPLFASLETPFPRQNEDAIVLDIDKIENDGRDKTEKREKTDEPARTFTDAELSQLSVEMSLCGHLLKLDPNSDAGKNEIETMFNVHRVTYEHLQKDPSLFSNPKLVVKLDGKYYPSSIAIPQMVSILTFRRSLPGLSLMERNYAEKAKKNQSKDRSWYWPWGRSLSPVPTKIGKTDEKPADMSLDRNTSPSSSSLSSGSSPASTQRSSAPVQAGTNVGTSPSSSTALIPSSPQSIPSSVAIDINSATSLVPPEDKRTARKTLRPTSEQLKSLNLKPGMNKIIFSVSSNLQGTREVEASIFLWEADTRIVISDIDGTITKSDVMGQVAPFIGRDWTHSGVAQLYSNIAANGYKIMYLTSRAIGQASLTKGFLTSVKHQNEGGAMFTLPEGPVFSSPNRLLTSFNREVIRKNPEEFKIACLKDIRTLFHPDAEPFYAGFGNRYTDAIAYKFVGVGEGKIFTINPLGIISNVNNTYKKSYHKLNEIVEQMFPMPKHISVNEMYNEYNYWKPAMPVIDQFDF